MRAAILLLLLLLPAQAPAEHVLRLGAGLRSDTVREDLLVPLGFSGPGLRLGAGYLGTVGPGLLAAQLEIGMSHVWNRFGHGGIFAAHGADVSYLLPASSGADQRLHLGGIVATEAGVHYLYRWDDAHGWWLGTHWLGPSARLVTAVSPSWRIEATSSLALLGLQSRPPAYRLNKQDALTRISWWFVDVHGDPALATIADLQIARVDVLLRRAPRASADAAGGWGFGIDGRLRRSTERDVAVELSAVLHASYGWRL